MLTVFVLECVSDARPMVQIPLENKACTSKCDAQTAGFLSAHLKPLHWDTITSTTTFASLDSLWEALTHRCSFSVCIQCLLEHKLQRQKQIKTRLIKLGLPLCLNKPCRRLHQISADTDRGSNSSYWVSVWPVAFYVDSLPTGSQFSYVITNIALCNDEKHNINQPLQACQKKFKCETRNAEKDNCAEKIHGSSVTQQCLVSQRHTGQTCK